MSRPALTVALAIVLTIPGSAFGQATDSSSLVGLWEGRVENFANPSGPNRSLRILSLDRGKGRGAWFVTGADEYVAKIAADADRVSVITVANVKVELRRQGEDQLRGTFTLPDGASYPVTLTKSSESPDPASLALARDLVGQWDGEIRFRYNRGFDPRYTLWIDSASDRNGQLTVKGRFGPTGKPGERISIEVDDGGGTRSIRFMRRDGNVVTLRRLGTDALGGILKYRGADAGEDPINLKRAD